MTNNKDWSSNSKSVSASGGFGSHSEKDRVDNDYYATHPIAITELFKLEQFNSLIIEPSCGEGHLVQGPAVSPAGDLRQQVPARAF